MPGLPLSPRGRRCRPGQLPRWRAVDHARARVPARRPGGGGAGRPRSQALCSALMRLSPTAAQAELRWSRVYDRVTDAFGLVLLLLILTYIAGSLLSFHGVGGVVIVMLGALSATIALATARARTQIVVWAGRLSVVMLILTIIGAAAGSRTAFGVAAIMQMLLLGAAGAAVLRAVVTEEQVGFRTILGAISVYIILGLLFTFVYVAVDKLQGTPLFGASTPVQRGDFLFFSLTTLTTTGYGNLVPAGQPGKMLAAMEMLMGQIFLVTLIARLVSMWRPGRWLRGGAGIAVGDDEGRGT